MSDPKKVEIESLRTACEAFRQYEGPASYYDIAMQIRDDHPLHASLILLATWNTGNFRYHSDGENVLNKHLPSFPTLRKIDFQKADFNGLRVKCGQIYSDLAGVQMVSHTGASKIMYLFLPNLFVMWDDWIRGKKVAGKSFGYGYKAGTENFFSFQQRMQEIFGHIEWNDTSKSLAKAVDEYNFIRITIPGRKWQEKVENEKKATNKAGGALPK